MHVRTDREVEKPEEKALDIPEQIMDQIRLVSVYKGVHVPSILFEFIQGQRRLRLWPVTFIEGIEQGRYIGGG